MREIKTGDKIYFQGNQGEVMRVTSDENEPLLEVVLNQKRVAYLNPSQLDLYPFSEQLNENQENVLFIMKNIQKRWPHFHPSTVVDELIGLESEYHEALSKTEELQVFKIFMIWALEQEEG